MRSLLMPIAVLLAAALITINSLLDAQSKRDKERSAISVTQKKTREIEDANKKAQTELETAYDTIARGRDFLTSWQTAQTRSARGGVENMVQEIAAARELVAATPTTHPASAYMTSEKGPVMARKLSFRADGGAAGLLTFLSSCEVGLPLGIVESVSLRPTDRDPKIDIELMVLDRAFGEMPQLPETAPAPDNRGVFALRPSSGIEPVVLPATFFARASGRQGPDRPTAATATDGVVKPLQVTGMAWSSVRSERRLMTNGYMLREGSRLPGALVSGPARVWVKEILRDKVLLRIETDVFNSVSQKTDTETTSKEVKFLIFDELTSEG